MTLVKTPDGIYRSTLCDIDAEIIRARLRKLILGASDCPRVSYVAGVVNRACHDYIENPAYRGRAIAD